jgi:hypothetical protein
MCYLLRILCLPGEVKAIVSHLPAGATWHNTGPFAATARLRNQYGHLFPGGGYIADGAGNIFFR